MILSSWITAKAAHFLPWATLRRTAASPQRPMQSTLTVIWLLVTGALDVDRKQANTRAACSLAAVASRDHRVQRCAGCMYKETKSAGLSR